jgi:hypothetical protein
MCKLLHFLAKSEKSRQIFPQINYTNMKKNNLGLCFVFLITVISLSPTLTYAKVTTEQVKQVMFDRSIPTWKNLAQKSQQVIDNPPNHQSKDLWHSLDEIEKSYQNSLRGSKQRK